MRTHNFSFHHFAMHLCIQFPGFWNYINQLNKRVANMHIVAERLHGQHIAFYRVHGRLNLCGHGQSL
jgi:hypothetical protein